MEQITHPGPSLRAVVVVEHATFSLYIVVETPGIPAVVIGYSWYTDILTTSGMGYLDLLVLDNRVTVTILTQFMNKLCRFVVSKLVYIQFVMLSYRLSSSV